MAMMFLFSTKERYQAGDHRPNEEAGVYNHGTDALNDEVFADTRINTMLEGTDVRCKPYHICRNKAEYVLLEDEQGFTWEAEAVILTCPIPQLYSLFPEHAPPEWERHPYASNWTPICTASEPIPTNYSTTVTILELMRRGINDSNSSVLIIQWQMLGARNISNEQGMRLLI